jgi:hypothetical protein
MLLRSDLETGNKAAGLEGSSQASGDSSALSLVTTQAPLHAAASGNELARSLPTAGNTPSVCILCTHVPQLRLLGTACTSISCCVRADIHS